MVCYSCFQGTISECHALWWVGVVLVTVWIKYSFIDIVEGIGVMVAYVDCR